MRQVATSRYIDFKVRLNDRTLYIFRAHASRSRIPWAGGSATNLCLFCCSCYCTSCIIVRSALPRLRRQIGRGEFSYEDWRVPRRVDRKKPREEATASINRRRPHLLHGIPKIPSGPHFKTRRSFADQRESVTLSETCAMILCRRSRLNKETLAINCQISSGI